MGSKKIKVDILKAVLGLEVSKGHLKWRVSDLARHSKVSRPLIYYHFGNTKLEIVKTSIRIIANEYFGLTEDRVSMLKKGEAINTLLKTRKLLMSAPEIVTFYFKWRTSKTALQGELIQIEKDYQALLAEAFPAFSANQISAIHGIFFGLVTAPFLTDDAVRVAANIVGNLKSIH